MKKLKKQFVMMTLVAMALQLVVVKVASAETSNFGDVVINEIAWSGTMDSSNDEWIELFNNTGVDINLSGWSIEDDGSTEYIIESGLIPAKGYFLIEDSEDTVSNITADAVIGLSLANSGDSLILKNDVGLVVDEVNISGVAWQAGNLSSKASMERIDPELSANDNWATAVMTNESLGRNGSLILGTVKSLNSTYEGNGPKIYFDPFETIAYENDLITVSVMGSDLEDLYAYGFEINYIPSLIEFVSIEESDLLGGATAFNAALKNGEEGTLIVGNARLVNPVSGIDGNGKLFDLTFKVVSEESDSGEINFSANSFLSDSVGDVMTNFDHADINIGEAIEGVSPVANAKVDLGDDRYTLNLNWQEDLDGASYYLIKKEMPDGSFKLIAETVDPYFVDDDSLVPNVNYNYQVIAVKNNVESMAVEISAVDNRGLSGDNDKNDLVDGRDIEKLARAYGSEYGEENYNFLVDSNYDGIIDGNDLIDIGSNFALTY